jgi:Uma2 family endonuclease
MISAIRAQTSEANTMSSPTTERSEYIDAIDHLPRGAALRLPDVSWDEYEQLLSELAERSDLRLTFDRGRLEIVSPLPKHEKFARFIERMMAVLSEELKIEVEGTGCATLRTKRGSRGIEADCSYYVQNARTIIGQRDIDLDFDPPPDIAVEIDLTGSSRSKLSVYAALGVPEIWRYDGSAVKILLLESERYVERANSLAFPILTSEAIARFLEQSETDGQTTALALFRAWVKSAAR